MPEPLGDALGMHAFVNQQRRVGVAQVVKAQARQADAFADLLKPPQDVRIARRDEDDWPVLAIALALGCAIWTEDADFFGCGVATWTTDRVELYLAEVSEREQ